MSICTIKIIMGRIQAAHSMSPIAVFKRDDGQLDAVFTDTVFTKVRIFTGDKSFLGSFDATMNPDNIKSLLEDNIPKPIPRFTGRFTAPAQCIPTTRALDPMME